MVQLAYPGGRMSTRPLACLEPMGNNITGSIEKRLKNAGKIECLGRGPSATWRNT
jgi:hypothetical protein